MTIDEYLAMGQSQDARDAQGSAAGEQISLPAPPTEDDIRQYGYADVYKKWQGSQEKPDYKAMEKRQRNAATLALIGEIAQLGGQMFASGRGARRFQPIQSKVQENLSAIDKIRDAKLAYQQDASRGLLNAMYQDLSARRQEDAEKRSQAYQNARDEQSHRWQVELNSQNQDFQQAQREAQQRYQTQEREARQRFSAQQSALGQVPSASVTARGGSGQGGKDIRAWAYGADGNQYVLNSEINAGMAATLISRHRKSLPSNILNAYDSAYDANSREQAATDAIAYLSSKGKLSGGELSGLGYIRTTDNRTGIPFAGASDSPTINELIQDMRRAASRRAAGASTTDHADDYSFDAELNSGFVF